MMGIYLYLLPAVLLLYILYLKFHAKRLLRFFYSDAAEQYLQTGELPETAPAEALELLLHLSKSIGMRYADQIAKQDMEYQVLQSQINPHFLYNTLDAIRADALLCDNMQVAYMVENLARFFRYSISQKGDTVTIRDEIDNVQNYCEIQKYRFGERITVSIHIPGTVYTAKIPKMTIQPLVENAFYHGLERELSGHIFITAEETGQKILLKVSDDGKGITEKRLREINRELHESGSPYLCGKSLALLNVQKRLQILFGEDYGILVRSIEGIGTDIELLLPRCWQEAG